MGLIFKSTTFFHFIYIYNHLKFWLKSSLFFSNLFQLRFLQFATIKIPFLSYKYLVSDIFSLLDIKNLLLNFSFIFFNCLNFFRSCLTLAKELLPYQLFSSWSCNIFLSMLSFLFLSGNTKSFPSIARFLFKISTLLVSSFALGSCLQLRS